MANTLAQMILQPEIADDEKIANVHLGVFSLAIPVWRLCQAIGGTDDMLANIRFIDPPDREDKRQR